MKLILILVIFVVFSEISTKDYEPVQLYVEDYYVGLRNIEYGVDLEKPMFIFMYNDYKFNDEETEETVKKSKDTVGTVI